MYDVVIDPQLAHIPDVCPFFDKMSQNNQNKKGRKYEGRAKERKHETSNIGFLNKNTKFGFYFPTFTIPRKKRYSQKETILTHQSLLGTFY